MNPFPFPIQRPFTWVDLETTHKIPKLARIVELSIIQFRPDADEPIEWWTLLNPGVSIPKEATEKHGIVDDHVLMKPRFEDVAPKLIRAFQGCDIGGFHVRYDMEVLEHEFKRVGVSTEGPSARVLDPFRLWQILEPRTLSDAVERFLGRKHDGAHGAKADITATIEVAVHLLNTYRDKFPADLDQLHNLQFPVDPARIDTQGKIVWHEGDAVLTFGKHAYSPLKKIPRDYLQWLLKQELAFDTRTVIENAVRGTFPTRTPEVAR